MAIEIRWTETAGPLNIREFRDAHGSRTNHPGGGYSMNIPAGLLLRHEDGTVDLVGDINTLGGICDDCTTDERIVAFSDSLVALLPR